MSATLSPGFAYISAKFRMPGLRTVIRPDLKNVIMHIPELLDIIMPNLDPISGEL